MIPYGKQSISEEDIEAVVEVLRSDFLTCGPKVVEFEEAFAEMCGAKYAVACCNGTAALHLAMLAARIGPGDRVVTSPITFLASANCAAYVGATPDFVDIDPISYCLSPDELEANWKEDTRAVVAVDFAGQPAEMPRIAEIARKRGAIVIEDACHAVGGRFMFDGREYRIGGHPWADMTTFSFHPVKTMTTGEGGMVVTDNPDYAERMRCLRNHGMIRDPDRFTILGQEDDKPARHLYEMQDLGFNFRLSDIHAALGLSQLSRLEEFRQRRQEVVDHYNEAFFPVRNLSVPHLNSWLRETAEHKISWHLYVLRFDFAALDLNREELVDELVAKGVGSQVHYIPVYLQPWYKTRFNYQEGKCANAEEFYSNALSIPLYPSISDEEINLTAETIISLAA